MIHYIIPEWMLQHLDEAPVDRSIILLLRHSVRDALGPSEVGYDMPITPVGKELAYAFGQRLGARLKTMHTSPVARCIQTAEAVLEGAAQPIPVVENRLLGDPGVFVLDGKAAWNNWQTLGNEAVIYHMVAGGEPLSGLASPNEAALFLFRELLGLTAHQPGVHVFVTHDAIVAPTVARLQAKALKPNEWPLFMEGAFLWQDGESFHSLYRSDEGRRNGKLVEMTNPHVIEHARREVAVTLGLESGAHFQIAGGVFKSLLTGKPAKDIDIWPASEQDRDLIIRTLEARGAKRLPNTPSAHVFEIAGKQVDVPFRNTYPTLEQCVSRFDIALSAIGAEHHADGTWTSFIHPLALDSISRREVLLLRPFVNWKYALTTIERARRYAAELDFKVIPDDEEELWSVFEQQEPEMRNGMKERYEKTSRGGFGVLEELACLFP